MKYERLYESDELEKDIKSIVDKGYLFEGIRENNSLEYHYFLSHLRHDLFNWYPFKKEGTLLEIGSGYGQLTSLFTQKVNNVIAVENTESKAEIISKRASDATVIVSDFDKLDFDEKFDYIIMCNVFEYCKSFLESNNPFEEYLQYLKSFLKEDGVILIAISNRLGLKYFSGFKEEHSGQYFRGIDGYEDVDDYETFSKTELIDIIEKAGFNDYKFFYPYPDHEFPMLIHTDELVNKIPYERRPLFYDERADLFREDILNQTLAKDNLADYFSNSFLIEIRNSNNDFDTDNISLVKLNSDRREQFRTCTIIHSNEKVSKMPISQKAYDHIKKMHDEVDMANGKIKHLPSTFENGVFAYDFIKDKSFEDLLIETIDNNDKDAFFRILDKYYDALFHNSFETNEYATDEFLSVFKTKSDVTFHCHEKSNLDLTFSNIFIIDNEYMAIDYEWLFDFPVPLEYLLYRVIRHHRRSNRVFKHFITIAEVFNHYNLDISHFNLFKKWDKNFLQYVFGYIERYPLINYRIISKYNLDLPEKVDEYIELKLDSSDSDNTMKEFLKEDIVIKQRKIIDSQNKKLNKYESKINQSDRKISNQQRSIKKLNNKINSLTNSTSWRITKPLRKLKSIFK